MTTNRHRVGGHVNPKSLPRGPNGRALCRQCGVEVPKGRRTFCGDQCVDQWKIKTDPTFVRIKLFDRDRGVCALCGLDTVKTLKELHDLDAFYDIQYSHARRYDIKANITLKARLQDLGISVSRYVGVRYCHYGIWDADHIVPGVEGGGECGLDNYRTLGCRCHNQETAKLARRRSKVL